MSKLSRRRSNDFFNFDDAFFEFDSLRPVNAKIISTPEGQRIDIVAPGMKKSEFKIYVEDNTLVISSEIEKQLEKNESYKRAFAYSYEVPHDVVREKILATYTDGILQVLVPTQVSKKAERLNIEIK